MKKRFISILLSSALLFLAGCMVGPKYVKPSAPTAPAFKEQPPASFTGSDE